MIWIVLTWLFISAPAAQAYWQAQLASTCVSTEISGYGEAIDQTCIYRGRSRQPVPAQTYVPRERRISWSGWNNEPVRPGYFPVYGSMVRVVDATHGQVRYYSPPVVRDETQGVTVLSGGVATTGSSAADSAGAQGKQSTAASSTNTQTGRPVTDFLGSLLPDGSTGSSGTATTSSSSSAFPFSVRSSAESYSSTSSTGGSGDGWSLSFPFSVRSSTSSVRSNSSSTRTTSERSYDTTGFSDFTLSILNRSSASSRTSSARTSRQSSSGLTSTTQTILGRSSSSVGQSARSSQDSTNSATPFQDILNRSSSSVSSSGNTPFQDILNRSSSAGSSLNIQTGDCSDPQDIDGGIFGPIPDLNNCDMFGPVPTLDDYMPRASE